MMDKLIIEGRLPGLNELLGAANAGYRLGNKLKQAAQDVVAWHIRQQLRGVRYANPIILHYAYYEPNRKRDKDNIAGGVHKVVQDALVKQGVIKNDGWKGVAGFTDLVFEVDRQNPRIEVTIEEVADETKKKTRRPRNTQRLQGAREKY